MSDVNYQPNSHKYKADRHNVPDDKKRVERVVKGSVKVKKKSEISKFTDVFVSEDAANVKEYIVMDVLLPAAKKLIVDVVTDAINMVFYGEAAGRRKDSRSGNSSYVSYRNYSERDRRDERYSSNTRSRSTYDFDDITIPTRGEAEEVLTCMDDLLETYGVVTVADFYELVGAATRYTDNKYGWTNLRNVSVVRVRDGYMLKLPRATPVD